MKTLIILIISSRKWAVFCNSEKPTIIQFDDFYVIDNTKGRRMFYDFLTDYNESLEMKFSYTQTIASQDTNAILGNLFLTCASNQGKYLEFERQMAGIYCNNRFKGDETILTQVEINGCWTISDHFGTSLSQFELDLALARTTMDINGFLSCISDQDFLLNNAELFAEEVEVTRSGTFLLDCQETTNLVNLEESFCNRHPEVCVEENE